MIKREMTKMPYSSNAELPSGVKDALPESAQSTWRKIFNSAYEQYHDDSKATATAWAALKDQGWHKEGDNWVKKFNMEDIALVDSNMHTVFGWANVAIRKSGEQIKDSQKHMIDTEDLETAMYAFNLAFREMGVMHVVKGKGELIESIVYTKRKLQAMGLPEDILPEAAWVGFYIEDDRLWEKVKNGTYKMFSIEGTAIGEEV